MTWAWLSLLLIAAPITALWLRSPPPRAVRVSSLLLARALARADARRARPPLAELVELALVLAALGLCAFALAQHAGVGSAALRLLRAEGAPATPPTIEGTLSLVDLRVDQGLVHVADGRSGVEAALGQADPAPTTTGAPTPPGAAADPGPTAWHPLQAALHEERALAALRAQCATPAGPTWAALDPTAGALLAAAACPALPGAAPRGAAPLRVSARRTDALGAFELAVSGPTADPPALRLGDGPPLPVPLSAAGASPLGWAQLRWDEAAPAEVRLERAGAALGALPAPQGQRVRVGLWTAAPDGALARALRAHPAVDLVVLAPGAAAPPAIGLALLAAAPPAALAEPRVIAALGVDPVSVGAAWGPPLAAAALRLGPPQALSRYTSALPEEGAPIDGLEGSDPRALRLPAGATALWLGPAGPTLGAWTTGPQTRVALGLDAELAVGAGQLPVLHLLANLIELAGGGSPASRLAPPRADWFSAPVMAAAPPPSQPPIADPRPLLLAAAAALTLQAALRRLLSRGDRP
jgi:hypothetical protein